MINKFSRFFLFVICVFSVVSLYASEQDDMLASEKNTIDIFQKFSPKVVFVHRLSEVANHSYEKMHVTTGAGSGIIWDAQGHIVTNFHVIKDADKLMITIDNKTVPARVIGAEPRKDIAVLQIASPKALQSLKSFTPFTMASTNNLQVGQKVIAIGNPFGLDHSLTVGVISALGRQVPGIGGVTIRDMIQTDASINPGNSGGPLLDSKGRLLGMNTVIYSNSGASAGVGFAVPSDDIQRIVPQLIKNGRVILSGLGIHRVEPGIASRLGVRKGILIAEVLPNTPAAGIGLRGTHRDGWGRIQLGDVIVALNGHPVRNYDDLYNLLTDIKVGERVTLTVNRHNKMINYKIKTIDIAAY
ncbi:DegP protease (Do-like, S2-serine-like) [Legionella spiritensis]|uniref:DegP protease (Do-like, S2-serine-like) n=2 Tax=Legionella spiritensis TaxID=452 RepID=A0A0W0Z2J0_LEGSP|nr:trypsin-like peptidase domain-containing protein [Legionella spiritensis]KTD63352.1 DegP protease (Do-like, S2-serine-like) [Legionella spiritensis]SNV35416.1 DegP protease (Do-like, S2-serine-like) [Legionella spiritensis]VEG89754.1 DegP protease (Do-like, S2-serine-like) [Legionella spiritensis]